MLKQTNKDITIKIIADLKNINKSLKKLNKQVHKFSKETKETVGSTKKPFDEMGNNLKKVAQAVNGPISELGKFGLAVNGISTTIRSVTSAIKGFISVTNEQEQAGKRRMEKGDRRKEDAFPSSLFLV